MEQEKRNAVEDLINSQGWEVVSSLINERRMSYYSLAVTGKSFENNRMKELTAMDRFNMLAKIEELDNVLNLPNSILKM